MSTCKSFLVFFFFTTTVFAQQSSLEFKILLYNLHHGEGTDGQLDLQRIADIINSVDPIYAGLQEIDSSTSRTGSVDQPAEYGRLTNMNHDFARAITFGGGSYGNSILSDYDITNVNSISLPGGEARVAHISDIDVSDGSNSSNATVTFINTHWMNGGGASSDRLQSAQLINNWTTDANNGAVDRPMILMGDLNASNGSSEIDEIKKEWSVMPGFNYGIDWIFYRPANRWEVVSASKLDTGIAAIASDHLPVEQTMRLLLPNTNINTQIMEHTFNVYQSKSHIHIYTNDPLFNSEIQIFNSQGKELIYQKIMGKKTKILKGNLFGVHFIKLKAEKNSLRKLFIER